LAINNYNKTKSTEKGSPELEITTTKRKNVLNLVKNVIICLCFVGVFFFLSIKLLIKSYSNFTFDDHVCMLSYMTFPIFLYEMLIAAFFKTIVVYCLLKIVQKTQKAWRINNFIEKLLRAERIEYC